MHPHRLLPAHSHRSLAGMLSASRAFGPTCSRGCGALVPQSLGATREGAGSTRQSTCERERSAQEAAGGPAAWAGRESPLRPEGCFHRGAGLPSLVLFVASGVFCALLGDVFSLRSYQQHHCAGLCEPGCPPGRYTRRWLLTKCLHWPNLSISDDLTGMQKSRGNWRMGRYKHPAWHSEGIQAKCWVYVQQGG